MSRLEKCLGFLVCLVSLAGTAFVFSGRPELATVAIVVIGVFVLYLVAQLLRVTRSQKRTTELLREYSRMSRQALEAQSERRSAEMARWALQIEKRLESANQSIVSALNDGESRLIDSVVSSRSDILRSQQLANQRSIALQEGARHVLESLYTMSFDSRDELNSSLDVLYHRISAQSDRVDGQLNAAFSSLGSAVAEGEARIADSVAASSLIMREAQQIISQKTLAHQDGIRQVLDAVLSSASAQQEQLDAFEADLADTRREVAKVCGSPGFQDILQLLQSIDRGLSTLVSAHSDLEAQVRENDERHTARTLHASKELFGGINDAAVDTYNSLLKQFHNVQTDIKHVEARIDNLTSGENLASIRSSLEAQMSVFVGLREKARDADAQIKELWDSEAFISVRRDVGELLERTRKKESNSSVVLKKVSTIDDSLSSLLSQRQSSSRLPMGLIGARLDELRTHTHGVGGGSISEVDIDVAIEENRESRDRVWRTLQLLQSSSVLNEDERESALRRLYSTLGTGDVRQDFVLDIDQYDIGVSFRSQMVRLMLLKKRLRHHGYEISPRLNDKLADREFAQLLEIPVPTTRARGVPTNDVRAIPGTVLKPSVGESAIGVFYVQADGRLLSIRSREVYASLRDAKQEYARLEENVDRLTWIVEDAILDEEGAPAKDFKVFMFYGEVGMFREISRGQGVEGRTVISTYDDEGRPMVYRASDTLSAGAGVPDGIAEMAAKLSLESPVPFLRVDFLIGSDGPVLGEITPHPGGIYAGDALDEIDRRLGEMYLDADARLTIDLLNAKTFQRYFDAYRVSREF